MWFDSTQAESGDASSSLREDCQLCQNQNRLVFIPILVWTGVGHGNVRWRDDCGSIPHTLDQVMLLHRWEKILLASSESEQSRVHPHSRLDGSRV